MSNEKSNKSVLDAAEILNRLAIILGTKSSQELADVLETSPQAVSSWKSRNSIPYAKCVEVAMQNDVSLDWLLTGNGSFKAASPSDNHEEKSKGKLQDNLLTHKSVQIPLEELTEKEQQLLKLYRKLDDADCQAIYMDALHRKRLKDLEQRLNEIEGK